MWCIGGEPTYDATDMLVLSLSSVHVFFFMHALYP